MKYLQIYEEFGKDYQLINSLTDFKEGKTPESFKVMTQSDIDKIEKIIKDLGMTFFRYRSEISIDYLTPWIFPVYFRFDDAEDLEDEKFIEWSKSWEDTLNLRDYRSNPRVAKKSLEFDCKIQGIDYSSHYQRHYVSILKDDEDGFYYIAISLEGETKLFKCDQEHGVLECLKNELKSKKWLIFTRR